MDSGPIKSRSAPSLLFSLLQILSSRGAHQISIADLLMPGVSTAPATISHWRWKGNEQAGRRGDREALTGRRSAVGAAPVHSELRVEGRGVLTSMRLTSGQERATDGPLRATAGEQTSVWWETALLYSWCWGVTKSAKALHFKVHIIYHTAFL